MKLEKRTAVFIWLQAFTRTELLALLFTSLMLACVIFPALARSGDNGARTICFNNLRQMGNAVIMYGNDNRDYLALPNWDNGQPGAARGWLYYATNVGSSGTTIPDPGPGGPYATNPVAAYSTGLWFQYVQQPRAYSCPVDIESYTYQHTYAQGGRPQRLSSYGMNGAVCGYGATSGRSGCRISDVWNPACYLLWEPGENNYGIGNPGWFAFNDGSVWADLAEGPGRLHTRNGSMIVSVGGTVEFVTFTKFTLESNSSVKNLAWWSPFSSNGRP